MMGYCAESLPLCMGLQHIFEKGFFPRITWPARGSGAAVGVRYWKRDFWGRIDAAGAAFYSWRGYQHYDVSLEKLKERGGAWISGRYRGEQGSALGKRVSRCFNSCAWKVFR